MNKIKKNKKAMAALPLSKLPTGLQIIIVIGIGLVALIIGIVSLVLLYNNLF